jgi:hypothetical protein
MVEIANLIATIHEIRAVQQKVMTDINTISVEMRQDGGHDEDWLGRNESQSRNEGQSEAQDGGHDKTPFYQYWKRPSKS